MIIPLSGIPVVLKNWKGRSSRLPTKPTGTNLIQNIAKVARSASGNSGSLLVSSILRTNDVPNITNDYFWLGNSSGVATPTEFTSSRLYAAGSLPCIRLLDQGSD